MLCCAWTCTRASVTAAELFDRIDAHQAQAIAEQQEIMAVLNRMLARQAAPAAGLPGAGAAAADGADAGRPGTPPGEPEAFAAEEEEGAAAVGVGGDNAGLLEVLLRVLDINSSD